MKKPLIQLSVLGLAVFIISCTIFSKGSASLSDDERLFRSKCAACHRLPEPAKYAYQHWEKILQQHRTRIEISENEMSLILGLLKKQTDAAADHTQ